MRRTVAAVVLLLVVGTACGIDGNPTSERATKTIGQADTYRLAQDSPERDRLFRESFVPAARLLMRALETGKLGPVTYQYRSPLPNWVDITTVETDDVLPFTVRVWSRADRTVDYSQGADLIEVRLPGDATTHVAVATPDHVFPGWVAVCKESGSRCSRQLPGSDERQDQTDRDALRVLDMIMTELFGSDWRHE